MSLEDLVARAAAVPGALGAVLCDFEGEAVLTQLGSTPVPAAMLEGAKSQIPARLSHIGSPADFLLRLAGAEPCALLALFGQRSEALGGGTLEALELGFARVQLLVTRLPEDYYLVMVLDRTVSGGFARARRVAAELHPALCREVG